MRRAAAATERAIRIAFDSVRPGMSELDLDRVIAVALAEAGARREWNHIAFGPKGATIIRPTMNRADPGHVVRLDLGGSVQGYVCDMSRVAVLGEPSPEVTRVYDAALGAYEALRAAVGPGARASDLHRVATEAMRRSGIQPLYTSVGHGIGRDVHEPPFLTPTDYTVLQPGMVLDLEIPLRIQGIGSINIEDEVTITADGFELINTMGRELRRIPLPT